MPKRPIVDKLWYDLDKQDKELLRKISIYLESKKYDLALKNINSLHQNYKPRKDEYNPFFVEKEGLISALKNIVLWHKYSNYEVDKKEKNSDISFSDISRFVADNQFYPNIESLQRKAEKIASKDNIPYRLSEQYFISNPALDLDSKLYIISAKEQFLLQFDGDELQKDKIAQEIRAAIIDIWVNENFEIEKEVEFFEKYSDYLTAQEHQDRINRLLWDSRFDEAKRIFSYVSEDYQELYESIIKIRKLPKYINHLIFSVSRKLRKDENLTHARVLWSRSKDDQDEVVDLLLDVDADKMKYPQRWWGLRRLYARELLKTKDYKDAYRIISNHGLRGGEKNHWEGEWMSGWIALRFLDKPEIAYEHFLELYNNVRQPVSLARASYWLGMAANAMGDKNKAIDWYKIASNYPLYFYGQLGIHKHRMLDPLNATQDIILPKDPDITVGDARKVASLTGAQVGYLLALMGDKFNATRVFAHEIKNAEKEGEIAVIMRIVNELDDREMNSIMAREASKKNVFFIRDKFQMIDEVENNEYGALVHAIIKQESGFMASAVSSVGAIGFMQIMPDTARNVAKDLGVRYSKRKLATDIKYNIKLGSHYIKQMVDRFDGSEMLAIASYNAGPHNADRWIREFYDPRDYKDIDKVVDWIELITYAETRNYVQRIMENLIVYKYLMKNK